MHYLRGLALISILCNGLSYLNGVGIYFVALNCILTTLIYYKLDRVKLTNNAWQDYSLVVILNLVFILVFKLGSYFEVKLNNYWLIILIAYILCLLMAVVMYRLATQIDMIAKYTNQRGFVVAAIFLKVAVFTMPLLIGLVIWWLSQLMFLWCFVIYGNNKFNKILLTVVN